MKTTMSMMGHQFLDKKRKKEKRKEKKKEKITF
jgi:hypothetical protein